MGKVFKALLKADSADRNDAVQQLRAAAPDTVAPESQQQPRQPAQQTPPGPAVFVEERLSKTVKGWDERIIAASGTDSGIAEEFRRLRTHILHPPGGEKPARTILVASAAPEEGKTFVCAGLAVSLAQSMEGHVLMVDCDLRWPTLAGMFGLGNTPGLADHLREQIDLGRLIRKTSLGKLSLIASGAPPINPAELLGSDRLTSMVAEVANRYQDRYIIFDSPPLQKAAETAILAKQVDGVVLVVREGKSSREHIRQLVETIGPDRIIAVVFNAYQVNILDKHISGHYGGGYYSSRVHNRTEATAA